jgi:hypothetical protein
MKPKRLKNERKFKRSAIFKRLTEEFLKQRRTSAWKLLPPVPGQPPEVDMKSAPTYRVKTARKTAKLAPRMTRMHYSDDEAVFSDDDVDMGEVVVVDAEPEL